MPGAEEQRKVHANQPSAAGSSTLEHQKTDQQHTAQQVETGGAPTHNSAAQDSGSEPRNNANFVSGVAPDGRSEIVATATHDFSKADGVVSDVNSHQDPIPMDPHTIRHSKDEQGGEGGELAVRTQQPDDAISRIDQAADDEDENLIA